MIVKIKPEELAQKYTNKYPGKITLLKCCDDCEKCCDCKLKTKKLYDYGAHSETRI